MRYHRKPRKPKVPTRKRHTARSTPPVLDRPDAAALKDCPQSVPPPVVAKALWLVGARVEVAKAVVGAEEANWLVRHGVSKAAHGALSGAAESGLKEDLVRAGGALQHHLILGNSSVRFLVALHPHCERALLFHGPAGVAASVLDAHAAGGVGGVDQLVVHRAVVAAGHDLGAQPVAVFERRHGQLGHLESGRGAVLKSVRVARVASFASRGGAIPPAHGANRGWVGCAAA